MRQDFICFKYHELYNRASIKEQSVGRLSRIRKKYIFKFYSKRKQCGIHSLYQEAK